MRALRLPLAIVGVALLCWIGWAIIQVTRTDELARTDPDAALRIDQDHPQALLRLARNQLEAGRYDAAKATARRVLAVEPGQGDAFAMLALAANAAGDTDAAAALSVALRRAPRNIDIRTQAMVAALRNGDLQSGMDQLDAMLRLSPRRGEILFPAMAEQTADPKFTEVLVTKLAAEPPWRAAFLGDLSRNGTPSAVDRIHAGLHARDALSEVEVRRWLNRKLKDGRWGEAYAHWIGTLEPRPATLPPVFNGGFENPPSNIGFDWHQRRGTGVFTTLESEEGATGERAAHFHFIGRPAARGGLTQPLLLSAGRYQLSLRARAEFLQSERGLEWVIRCAGGGIISELGPLEGSFEWRRLEDEFTVPAANCPGQWLELRNPAVRGTAQKVSGDLWIDDVAIASVAGPVVH